MVCRGRSAPETNPRLESALRVPHVSSGSRPTSRFFLRLSGSPTALSLGCSPNNAKSATHGNLPRRHVGDELSAMLQLLRAPHELLQNSDEFELRVHGSRRRQGKSAARISAQDATSPTNVVR